MLTMDPREARPHRNHGPFSDHYLDDALPNSADWQALLDEAAGVVGHGPSEDAEVLVADGRFHAVVFALAADPIRMSGADLAHVRKRLLTLSKDCKGRPTVAGRRAKPSGCGYGP